MTTIAQFTFQGAESKEYLAEVSTEESNNNFVRVTYSLTWDNKTELFPIEFDTKSGAMKFSGIVVPNLHPYVMCLAVCGLSHITDEILDCWKKGNRTPVDLLRCLRAKKVSIVSGLSGCAIKCLFSIGGGAP